MKTVYYFIGCCWINWTKDRPAVEIVPHCGEFKYLKKTILVIDIVFKSCMGRDIHLGLRNGYKALWLVKSVADSSVC